MPRLPSDDEQLLDQLARIFAAAALDRLLAEADEAVVEVVDEPLVEKQA